MMGASIGSVFNPYLQQSNVKDDGMMVRRVGVHIESSKCLHDKEALFGILLGVSCVTLFFVILTLLTKAIQFVFYHI